MLYSFLKFLFGPVFKAVYIRKIEGAERIPKKGPVVLVANHSGHFDAIFLILASPRLVSFLTTSNLYKNPFARFILEATGQIKVDFSKKDKSDVYRASGEALAEGKCLGVFPEGHRHEKGKLSKAYLGAARIALENGVDIVPVALEGAWDTWPYNHPWPSFRKVVTIKVLKPIRHKEIASLDPEEIMHDLVMPALADGVGRGYDHRLSPKER